MKRKLKRKIFACAHLKFLSYYYSLTAENREVKALCTFEVLLHQANLDFAYLSSEALEITLFNLQIRNPQKAEEKPWEKNK